MGLVVFIVVTVIAIVTQLTQLTTALTFTLSQEELETLRVKIAEASGSGIPHEANETEHLIRQNPNKIFAVLVAGSNGYQNYRHQVS